MWGGYSGWNWSELDVKGRLTLVQEKEKIQQEIEKQKKQLEKICHELGDFS